MFRLGLLLTLSLFCAFNAEALRLGDSREQIVAQYGVPASGDLPVDRGMGTYQWNGWRLDIEIMQGTAQRLIFTKDASPISEAEERQLLNDNGSIAVWQPVDCVAVDALAAKKWHRASDGAEAFTLANDGRVMCLVTGAWATAWTREHTLAVLPQRPSAATSDDQSQGRSQEPATSFAAWVLVAMFVVFVWAVGRELIRVARNRRIVLAPTSDDLRTPAIPPVYSGNTRAVPPPPVIVSAQSVLSSDHPKPKTLADLSWQEFELVVGELYRRQGYTVELCSGEGADGGVDLRLLKDGQTTLVQCKHWKVYKVGVSTVRELFGILAAEQAHHAILVTTGRFTLDALAFAAGKPLEPLDGTRLQSLVEQSRYNNQGDLLDVGSWSSAFARSAVVADPLCPLCRSSMVLRVGKQSGNRFWGCSTFPSCRGKRNVRLELMRA